MVIQCPYCGNHSRFDEKHHFDDVPANSFHVIGTCDVCKKVVYFETHRFNFNQVTRQQIRNQFPMVIPNIHESVPSDVAKDYKEALICFQNNCFKASAVMCRRALQSSALEKGSNKNGLNDQITELGNKGILTPNIVDWAHQIRLIGNDGAHSDKYGLKNVAKEDAEEILSFTDAYLKYVYEMPWMVAQRKKKP